MTDTLEEEEARLKKKMQIFTVELVRCGTVKGFKFFAMYLRGKEELIVSVVNEPLSPDNSYESETTSPLASSFTSGMSIQTSFTSGSLPYDKRSLMLSARTQRQLSGYGDVGIGLPPASPSEFESVSEEKNSTLFLLAAYARYNCPYVWVRSNHKRIINFSDGNEEEKDNPLKLKSTQNWLTEDVKLWIILGELVRLCTYPPPLNPFAIDFSYFEELPCTEKIIASGATLNFLQKVILSEKKDKPYTAKVFEDIERLSKLHYHSISQAMNTNAIPSLRHLSKTLHKTERSGSEDSSVSSRRSSLNYPYPSAIQSSVRQGILQEQTNYAHRTSMF